MKSKLMDIFKRTFELEFVDEFISQKNCEKWDSLNHLNLIVEIEDEFNISLEPNEIGEMIDFSSVLNMISSKVSK